MTPHQTETISDKKEIAKENKIEIFELKSKINAMKNSLEDSGTFQQAEERV